MLQELNFPSYPFKIRRTGEVMEIWDAQRKKWVVLTPEEWVRCHLVQYLIQEKQYPAGLVSVEQSLRVFGLNRRADVVVYNREGKPLLLAECKAPGVRISQEVFDQATRYNISLGVPVLVVTSGMEHFCCTLHRSTGKFQFVPEIPGAEEMLVL